MLADYLFASEVNADKTRAKLKTAPFVVAMSEVPMIAEHNLTGYITDETAMRLYCCDRFHFEKARELLALPDSKDGPKSTADLAADQACIAVIDRTIEAVKTATPLLFPQGIQSHKLAGLKPSGRVRPPKEATVPAPDSMSL